MDAHLGIGVAMPAAWEFAVAAADQIEQVFSEFDVVRAIVDTLSAVGFLHEATSISL